MGVPRHYVVMEVKQNLVAADSKANLQRFNLPHFKRVAQVVMGEPKKDFKEKTHAKLLQEKQVQEDEGWKQRKVEFEKRKAERARKKLVEQKRKEMVEAQKKTRKRERNSLTKSQRRKLRLTRKRKKTVTMPRRQRQAEARKRKKTRQRPRKRQM